jgi:tetratricopeptide (TPR) repeat protein
VKCFVRTIFIRGKRTFREILMISLSFLSTQDRLMGSQSTPRTQLDQNCISKTMKSILQSEGITILDNPKIVRALLSDLCAGDWKREIILLERLLEEKVHLELIRQKNSVSYEILSANLTNRILLNQPFDKDLVESGIDNLAIALEIIKMVPERNSLPKKIPSIIKRNGGNSHGYSQNQSDISDDEQLVSQAIKFNQLKNFQNAIPLLTRVLETDPKNTIALREKGFSISNLGRYEEAIGWYEKSIGANPNDSMTWTYKGYALSKIGKIRDSIKCYDMAIQIDPQNAAAWRSKGYSLVKIHDDRGAMACYQKALSLDPDDPFVWNLIGWLKRDLNDKLDAFNRSLSLDPDYIPAMNNKGWVLSKLGKYQEALTLYERILANDINNQKARKERSYCLRMIREQTYKKPHPIIYPPPRAPTPENQGIMDKIKGFFK